MAGWISPSIVPQPFLQVRYQYRSPQKIQGEGNPPAHPTEQQARRGTLQGGGSRGPRAASGTFQAGSSRGGGREGKGRPKERQLEATSDYGTMSRWSWMMVTVHCSGGATDDHDHGDDDMYLWGKPWSLNCRWGDQDVETDDLLEAMMPNLNLSEGDAIFSEVSHHDFEDHMWGSADGDWWHCNFSEVRLAIMILIWLWLELDKGYEMIGTGKQKIWDRGDEMNVLLVNVEQFVVHSQTFFRWTTIYLSQRCCILRMMMIKVWPVK